MRESVEAMIRSDIDTLARLTSREPYVLGIGSDPGEWCEGYEELMRLYRESVPDGGPAVTIGVEDVKAFQEGTVGWLSSHGYFEIDGKRVPVRMTAVVHREDGEWKAVQTHASIGVPNERMLDPMFQPAAAAAS